MTNVLLARLKKSMKQYEVAKKVGIAPQYLRLIEKGEVNLNLKLMRRLSEVLEVDMITLFFEEEEIQKTFNKKYERKEM